jgi:tRNA threonylcarbamoyladenosine biosynthesis protein TsaB
MLILATDTSGRYGSIALVRCQADTTNTVELVPLQGGTFSAQLIPQIAGLLDKNNLSRSDMGAFAVVTGPGSFTGLRVGLAAIKALAEILKKPIVAVSLLEVIASQTTAVAKVENRTVLAALDASRGEVFVGEYKLDPGMPSQIVECLLSYEELGSRISASSLPLYTPDDNVVRSLDSLRRNSRQFNIVRVQRPDAVSVARLGWNKIRAGRIISAEELDATYIRRADAEIKKPRPAHS